MTESEIISRYGKTVKIIKGSLKKPRGSQKNQVSIECCNAKCKHVFPSFTSDLWLGRICPKCSTKQGGPKKAAKAKPAKKAAKRKAVK